jgi:16S rRNA G527 N7-methylase RsmG
MELHLSEKHRHSLVYNLPIGKANMDDRIEYALHLIETGTTTMSYQIPNSNDEEEKEEEEEDEDEYQY